MLRTNLSTRPFYNVRAVRALIGLFGLIVVAFTLFNVVEFVTLSARQRTLSADAESARELFGRLARIYKRLADMHEELRIAVEKADQRACQISKSDGIDRAKRKRS